MPVRCPQSGQVSFSAGRPWPARHHLLLDRREQVLGLVELEAHGAGARAPRSRANTSQTSAGVSSPAWMLTGTVLFTPPASDRRARARACYPLHPQVVAPPSIQVVVVGEAPRFPEPEIAQAYPACVIAEERQGRCA